MAEIDTKSPDEIAAAESYDSITGMLGFKGSKLVQVSKEQVDEVFSAAASEASATAVAAAAEADAARDQVVEIAGNLGTLAEISEIADGVRADREAAEAAALTLGATAYATAADLPASHAAQARGYVYADATDANNGLWFGETLDGPWVRDASNPVSQEELAAEVAARKAAVEVSSDSEDLLLLEDSFGMGIGYINVATGAYLIGDVQISDDGLVTPTFSALDDGNDADQTIYMIDSFGMGLGTLGGDDDGDTGGGGGEPTTLVAQPAPTYKLLQKLRARQAAAILVCSDSTGAGTDRWVYKIANAIHAWDGSVRVEYRPWNDTTKAYNAATVVHAGTGGPTCTIYNGAVPGKQLFYQHGAQFEAAYGVTGIDWLIVNHGHNHDYNWSFDIHAAILIGGVQQLAMRHPRALVSVVAQNPLYGSENGTNRSMGAVQAAAIMGWHLIDVFGMYKIAGKPSGWYDGDGSDPIHPSVASGGGDDAIYTNLILPMFSDQVAQYTHRPPTLDQRQKNLLANGDFSVWTTPTAAPDGWTTTATAVAQDASIYETAGKAARITSSGNGHMYQDLSGDVVRALRGKYVTMAVRTYIPAATTGAPTQVDISTSSDGATFSSSIRGWAITSGNGRDGWIWCVNTVLVPVTATHIRARTPGAALTSGQQILIDRAILVPGALPFDMEL